MQVEVVRSTRRRKTVELRPTPDGVRISIPARATKAEEEKYVSQLLSRYQKRQQSNSIDLAERARRLAHTYDLLVPQEIRFVENQASRWGSCTPSTSTIRISDAVAKFPNWVIDYVIIHELAHLSVLEHSPKFWQLVERYPKTERARGFLIAKGLDAESGVDHPEADLDLTDAADIGEEVS